ncbi:ABC transporter ATP-binding protein [Temperatibacter marinus]|uniref:ABC transporter ATP-binding protein n=1 Tax=Temperatibacter marinus TaxID=1456591 RepID=A0AA52EJQ9_9PROT|nr:ABC transporter ATP-binding protein [Temperatibacter marinus]WND03296.1 ABC transporter ATP-binding protein [Temperatibacter marinus]
MEKAPIMLQAENLVKNFGPFKAVKDISLHVRKGEILGLLGPNGAGKTTTMQMLTGFLRSDGGQVYLCGERMTEGRAGLRTRIGYLPEGAPLYPDMTVKEYLDFIAEIHGLEGEKAQQMIMSAATAVHLIGVFDQIIDTLSKGYKRRVGLAGAILHAPDVLILDEPTDGLDPNQKYEVRRLIDTMAVDRAIIISTHILEEVEALCTRTVMINKGQVIADSTPSELKSMSQYNNAVTMLVEKEQAEHIAARLNQMRVVSHIEAIREGNDMRLTVVPVDQQEIGSRIEDMASITGWPVSELTVENGRLDDVFRTLTTRDPEIIKKLMAEFQKKNRQDRPYEYQ